MHLFTIKSRYSPSDAPVTAAIPRVGLVVSTMLSMLTFATLAVCLVRRVQAIKAWVKMPLTRWLILAIYIDSIAFIFTTNILEHGFGLNSNAEICEASILICLACYLSTKLIYYFLVEKAYIIRRVQIPRHKSKLYCFNCLLLVAYFTLVVLNFVYRVSYINADGTCIIGMQTKVVMPLILWDAIINFYLTLLFVLPLRNLYTYKNTPSSGLRTVALRSFIGSLGTLISGVVNLTVLMVLHGEAAWICLMCCNADVLFSVLILHWVTSIDSSGGSTADKSNSYRGTNNQNSNILTARGTVDKPRFPDIDLEGSVTTNITAVRDVKDFPEEDDISNIELGVDKKDGSGFPLRRITVQVGQVRKVEGGRNPGRVVSMVHGEALSRGGEYKSTEDLVERTEK